jgi:hypothetical protein
MRTAIIMFVVAAAAVTADALTATYRWAQLTPAAPYPKSYNYPVHVAPDGSFIALHPQGTWSSHDGASWTKSPLPFSGMNSAYLSYVQHDGATWAFGLLQGNYQNFKVDPVVQRTRDYRSWQTVGRSSSLPQRVFYAAASFRGAIWLLGGFDGKTGTADIWRSVNGLDWTRVVESAPWSKRSGSRAVVFRDRLYLIGGGTIDGPNGNDVWSSADGLEWRRETAEIAPEGPVGYTPTVFDDKIWLIGANRSGRFTSEMLVSRDGSAWQSERAPWSPRGGVAAWTDGNSLFMTGGKYSVERNGETTFIYSNDVWRMRKETNE